MLGSGMLVVGIFAGLTVANRALAASQAPLAARIAQVICILSAAAFFWPYFRVMLPLGPR
jgi:hypothetical protein